MAEISEMGVIFHNCAIKTSAFNNVPFHILWTSYILNNFFQWLMVIFRKLRVCLLLHFKCLYFFSSMHVRMRACMHLFICVPFFHSFFLHLCMHARQRPSCIHACMQHTPSHNIHSIHMHTYSHTTYTFTYSCHMIYFIFLIKLVQFICVILMQFVYNKSVQFWCHFNFVTFPVIWPWATNVK